MDIKSIKNIVNRDIPDSVKESMIIDELTKDKDVLPTLMLILNQERRSQKELIQDMNLELSRAHIYIETQKEDKKEEGFNKSFVIKEISNFYKKYKGVVRHCFNRYN